MRITSISKPAWALTILALSAMPALAAPLPIAVTTIPLAAADGNSNEAVIVVYLGKTDGTPNAKAEIPGPGADPNGGVELKGSKWSFETLSVPDSYSGKVWTDYAAVNAVSSTERYKDGSDQGTALGALTIR